MGQGCCAAESGRIAAVAVEGDVAGPAEDSDRGRRAEDSERQSRSKSTFSVCHFPIFAARASRIVTFNGFRVHEDMKDAGDLVEWQDDMGILIFVSHQWTSFAHPDHTGSQFRLLTSMLDLSILTGMLTHCAGFDYHSEPTMEKTGSDKAGELNLANIFVWLDYWSIAQKSKEQQRAAIRSIPAYASSAAIMLVLAPAVNHGDTGELLGLASYRSRGWCRAEETVYSLSDIMDGGAPRIHACEKIGISSRAVNVCTTHRLRDPNASVLRGAFTCCQLGHVDAAGNPIVCDKLYLHSLLESMEETVADQLLKQSDMPGWRRLLSTRWARMCEEPTPLSAEDFMDGLQIQSPRQMLEGDMYPIHYAVYANNVTAIRDLLGKGACLTCRDSDGNSPLILAATSDSSLAVSALLEARADIDDRNKFGVTPLMASIVLPGVLSMRVLIAKGADASIPFSESCPAKPLRGMAPVHFAAFHGHKVAMELLLQAKADAGAKVTEDCEFSGCTALELAHKRGHDSLVDFLRSELGNIQRPSLTL